MQFLNGPRIVSGTFQADGDVKFTNLSHASENTVLVVAENGKISTQNLDFSNLRIGTVSTSHGGTGLTSIGSANQILSVNGAGTALEWVSSGGTIDWTQDQGATNIHTGNYNNTQLSQEEVEDFVGAMFTSNTETRITSTYDDSTGKITLTATDQSYTLPTASSEAFGGIKIGYTTNTALSKYAVQLDSGKAYVNVPGASEASNDNSGTIKVHGEPLETTPAESTTTTSGRSYGLQRDANGRGVVNVPWTDTNTTYTVGDGGLTQKNFTTTLKDKLDNIAPEADVTPSWVPSEDPSYGTSNLTLGTSSTTAMRGDTTTITSAQANAINANTAKTGITTAQANAITANTAKTGFPGFGTTSGKAHDGSIRYSIQYITMHGQATIEEEGEDGTFWYFPKDVGGIEYYKFEDATDSVSSHSGTTSFTLPRASQHKGMIIPHGCRLVGYSAVSSASGNAQTKSSLWYYQPHYGEGGSGGTTCYRSHYAEADLTISTGNGQEWENTTNYTTRPAYHAAFGGSTSDVNKEFDLGAGYALLPAISGGGAVTHRVTFTIILKIPLTTTA